MTSQPMWTDPPKETNLTIVVQSILTTSSEWTTTKEVLLDCVSWPHRDLWRLCSRWIRLIRGPSGIRRKVVGGQYIIAITFHPFNHSHIFHAAPWLTMLNNPNCPALLNHCCRTNSSSFLFHFSFLLFNPASIITPSSALNGASPLDDTATADSARRAIFSNHAPVGPLDQCQRCLCQGVVHW